MSVAVANRPTPIVRPPSTVRMVVVPNAFRPEQGRVIKDVAWQFCGYISDYLPPECFDAPDSLVILRNGKRVDREQWARTRVLPSDEIGIVLWPAEPTTLAIIGLVITIVSAIVAGWSAADGARRAKIQGHHMARRQAAMSEHMQDSAVYGWDGIQNTTQPGRPILVVYGLHRVGGQVIYAEPYKNKLGKNSLDMTLCLSQGEIEEVQTSTIEINEQPISDYANINVESRLGTNDQTASDTHSPGMVVQASSDPGDEIVAAGGAITKTTQGDVTNYEVDIGFPGGLRMSSGLIKAAQAEFSIRHRVSPAGAWSTPVTVKSGYRWSTASFTLTHRSGPLTKDTYDIEITRAADNALQGPFGQTVSVDPLHSKSYLNQIREYDNTGLIYPNLALLHLSAIATDQVNGIMPTVTVVVKGKKVNVYTDAPGDTLVQSSTGDIDDSTTFTDDSVGDVSDGFQSEGVAAGDLLIITEGGTAGSSVEKTYEIATVPSEGSLTITGTFPATGTGTTYRIESKSGVATSQFSRNPAWCILDLMTNSIYGAGEYLGVGPWDGTEDIGDIDIQSFIDAAAYCDVLVSRAPSADDPIDSGSSAGSTSLSNTILLGGGQTLDVGVQEGDTFVFEAGNDAGSFRIDAISPGRNLITVSDTDGSTTSFVGDSGQSWHVNATEKRAQCDYVIDGQTNVLDAISAMASAARMVLVQGFGPFSLIPDQTSTPVAVFGGGNVIEGTYRHEYLAHRMLANRTEVQFLNAELNYQQDLVYVEDPSVLINNEEVVPDPHEAYSCTSLTQAQRIAKYHYLSNRYEREMIEFETSIEGLPVRVFETIVYVHELARVDQFFTGRAAQGTDGLTLKLGQAITVPAGTVDVYLQTHDETAAVPDGVMLGTIQEAAGSRVDTVTVTEWTDLANDVTYENGPTKDDNWVLVPRESPQEKQRRWKVVSVSLGQEGRRKIRAVAYREEVYNEDPVPATLVA